MARPTPERLPIQRLDRPCPKCGSRVYGNGVEAWCSMLRQDTGKPEGVARACLYGINPKVTVEQHKEAP
jgi:hypothetical protein